MKLTEAQKQEIAIAKGQKFKTHRPTVPALEEKMFEPIQCLDSGFVRLIDYMGDDAAITQAARVSYGKGTKAISNDRGLIRYLMRHRHTSPFEMNEIKLHVKMPIFVARQWIRHRTANVNEISARYSILDKEFYLPDPENIAVQSKNNKQGRGKVLNTEQSAKVLEMLKADAVHAYETYETLLSDEYGLARELARMNLPVNWYTQWYWKVDLHNLLHFLSLRMDSHAQYEIRVFADAIGGLVKSWCPITWEAFEDYRLGGAFLSSAEIDFLKYIIHEDTLEIPDEWEGISKREMRELKQKFDLGDRLDSWE